MVRRVLVASLALALAGSTWAPEPVAASQGAAPGSGLIAAPAAARSGMYLRVATFNVRTARANDKRSWLTRAPDVAREILSRRPDVVALQELGPGRADGKKAKINGALRQTTSLTAELARRGGGHYKLVRTTSYVKPGAVHGTQGSRILYNSRRFAVSIACPETTGKSNYNSACSLKLPILAGASAKTTRSAAFVRLRERRTGRQFWVISAHLENRHSKSSAKERAYNALRARQAAAAAGHVSRLNRAKLPVVFGGDINSWQTDRGNYAPHRALRARGFADTVTAPRRYKLAYPTVNHFKTRLKYYRSGAGPRLDVVMVKGMRRVGQWENKAKIVDPARPSDHNLVLADLVL